MDSLPYHTSLLLLTPLLFPTAVSRGTTPAPPNLPVEPPVCSACAADDDDETEADADDGGDYRDYRVGDGPREIRITVRKEETEKAEKETDEEEEKKEKEKEKEEKETTTMLPHAAVPGAWECARCGWVEFAGCGAGS